MPEQTICYAAFMKYQIDDFILDAKARTLSDINQQQNVRPKTLAVLLYLAQRSGNIISKQELLAVIWDDVNVDDGVIFQSIREIRQLFSNAKIIQNHPRKGYEFTTNLEPVADHSDKIDQTASQLVTNSESKKTSKIATMLKQRKYFPVLIILLLTIVSAFVYIENISEPNQLNSKHSNKDIHPKYRQNIVVMPIKNKVPYGEHEWVYLGAMEQLIAKLTALPDAIYVHQGSYIPRLMHMAGISRDFSSAEVNKIFVVSGASLIIEAELYGNVADYKLIYKFHLANDVKQGAILGKSVNDTLSTLAEKIAAFIQQPLQRNADLPMKEFNDALFAKAIINYEADWQTSISFFESYLALNPASTIAAIYLSKLYLWNDRVEQAEKLILTTEKFIEKSVLETAEIHLIKAKIAVSKQHWKIAERQFLLAKNMLKSQNEWFLQANIAEARGLSYLKQKLLTESAQAFNAALTFYQIIDSPIGINATQLHLANVLFQQGKNQQASKLYRQTKNDIEKTKLEFLYGMLSEYSAKFQRYNINEKSND